MKFQIDHDLHIHSKLSFCSKDPLQSPAAILAYAEKNGYSSICLTDHYWDEALPIHELPTGQEWTTGDWYRGQNTAHIREALPLPSSDKVKFHFGCETDMDIDGCVGVAEQDFDNFDFIIVPTTHLHMNGFSISDEDAKSLVARAKVYLSRWEKLLASPLPAGKKVGLAHITCRLLAPDKEEDHLSVLDSIPDATFRDLFTATRDRGIGVELNFTPASYTEADRARAFRPYFIAKDAGCKFYLGSDAHHPADLEAAPARFRDMVDTLGLTEEDKFTPSF